MRKPTHYTNLSVLSSTETPADSIGFFEAVKLAGLEGQEIRVSVAVQKKHFGKVVFGKKTVVVSEDCTVEIFWTVGPKALVEQIKVAFDFLSNAFGTVYNGNFSEGFSF